MKKIEIDYFELTCLVESAWFSGTILRHSIMQKAIGEWYGVLSDNQRKSMYDFFLRTKGDEMQEDIQKIFMARYNPDTQFEIKTVHKGKEEMHNAYLYNGKYYVSETVSLVEEFIVDVKQKSKLVI